MPTDNAQAFYEAVEGCGIRCQNPLLTEDEHRQIHQLIAWAGTICLLFNLFTVVNNFFETISYDLGVLLLLLLLHISLIIILPEF